MRKTFISWLDSAEDLLPKSMSLIEAHGLFLRWSAEEPALSIDNEPFYCCRCGENIGTELTHNCL